jgi:arylsulfatase A-like enzyme
MLLWSTTAAFSQSTTQQALQGDKGVLVVPPVRPNVLLVVLDDVGVDMLSAYGECPSPAKTPVIKKLADGGVLFRNAWATPGCSPTRAMILTGRYGFRTGIGRSITYSNSPVELSVDEHTIADAVRHVGYRTAIVGKWHLGCAAISGPTHALALGFEHHLGTVENLPNEDGSGAYYDWQKDTDGALSECVHYATTQQVDDAIDTIHGWGDQPWFLWLAFNAAHAPYHKPPSSLQSYQLPDNCLDDIPSTDRAMLSAADTELGRLLKNMDPAVLARTVIIVIGDNGTSQECVLPPFVKGKSKATLYEGGVNVPLIVKGPGIAVGAECAGLVSLVDLFDTIAELAGSNTPWGIDSMSLVPYFSDPEQPSMRPWVYSEAFGPNGLLPHYVDDRRAVRDERYKLIVWQQGQVVPEKQEFFDLWADKWERFPIALDQLTPEQQAAYDNFFSIMGSMKPWY